jgi:hypothetical protein
MVGLRREKAKETTHFAVQSTVLTSDTANLALILENQVRSSVVSNLVLMSNAICSIFGLT